MARLAAVSRSQVLSALALGVVTVGPALWIGGALPPVVPALCVGVLVLWVHGTRRAERAVVVPWAAVLGGLAALLAFAQWVPWAPLQAALAPELAAQSQRALAGSGVAPWRGASVVPGETALAAARMVGLTALFVLAAQRSWRVAAVIVAATGSVVALVGFVHVGLGLDRIFGVYTLVEAVGHTPALRTSFVNPNHQSSLLLLGLFAAVALAVDQRRRALTATDPGESNRHSDRMLAALAAVTLQLPALVLSLSRGALMALVLALPWLVWLILRRGGEAPGTQRPRTRTPLVLRAAGALALVLLVIVVASHGAWAEIQTLADVSTPGSSAAVKIRLFWETLGLVEWGRPFGVGRGTFVDVFAAVDSAPSHVVYTHAESIPAGLLAEFGWLGGGVLLLGTAAWFLAVLRGCSGKADGDARRIVLLGLAAVALHNTLDFSLQLLGVAAPVAVMAGGLSTPRWRVTARRARVVGAASLLGSAALAWWALPHTVAARPAQDAAVVDGAQDGASLLPMRPLDGRLLGLVARTAAEHGRWHDARQWALRSIERRHGAPDAWLVLGAAERAQGRTGPGDQATRAGLERLHAPPSAELVEHLLAQYPSPAALAAIVPVTGDAWERLSLALQAHAPRFADAVAAARIDHAPHDPRALAQRHRIALRDKRPALALHHARLWSAADPNAPQAHVGVARAYKSFTPARLRDARRWLQRVLSDPEITFATQADRGVVEQELLQTLVAIGDDAALAAARALAPDLLSRPAPRAVHRQREHLARQLREGF